MSLGRGFPVRPMTFDSKKAETSDVDGGDDFTGAEEERARFMGDGMRRAEPQEPVWKIVSKGRF